MKKSEEYKNQFLANLPALAEFGIDESWLGKKLKLTNGRWAKFIGINPRNTKKPAIAQLPDGTMYKMSINAIIERITDPQF